MAKKETCPTATEGLPRRQFLNILGWGSISALGLGLVGTGARFLVPNRTGPSSSAFVAGKLEDFRQKVTYINGRRTFIVKTEQGVRALSATCTHLGCTVNWVTADDQLECPCHGSIFAWDTGSVLGGPAPRPLDWYLLTLQDNGELLVDPEVLVEPDRFLVVG